MRLYFLDLGYTECDTNLVVTNTTIGTIKNKHVENKWGKLPIAAQLIITDSGKKILFDCGCHPDSMNGHWQNAIPFICPLTYTPEQTLQYQLGLCGLKPEDIDMLVISHMHTDHIGNIHLFKNAQVVVSRKELESALVSVFQTSDLMNHGFFIKDEVSCDVKNYILIEGDYELGDGITLISLPGHTAGMMGMKLALKNTGTVILMKDSCFTAANYGPPAVNSPILYDSVKFFESIQRVREMTRLEKVSMVIFGHDQQQFETLKHARGYYD